MKPRAGIAVFSSTGSRTKGAFRRERFAFCRLELCGSSTVHTALKAVKTGKARRFQAELEPNRVLEGEDLIEELARYGYANERVRAELAMTIFEGFVVAKLAEGYRIDTGLVSFVPRLSGALSTRDIDPETDGLYVQGSVTARGKLRHALRDKIEAVNPLARRKCWSPNRRSARLSFASPFRADGTTS